MEHSTPSEEIFNDMKKAAWEKLDRIFFGKKL